MQANQDAAQADLIQHLRSPEFQRDGRWEARFFELFLNAHVSIRDGAPKAGPDQMPYLFCTANEEAKEPVRKVLMWLSERGIGLALNPGKEVPDYVFTYGMVWNLRERGTFLSTKESLRLDGVSTPTPATGSEPVSKEQTATAGESPSTQFFTMEGKAGFIAGPPTEAFLPTYVRKILQQFFLEQALWDVKTLVISPDGKNFDLCFSLESLGNPPGSEHAGILEALSWFVPSHYSLAIVSEKGLPPFVSMDPARNQALHKPSAAKPGADLCQ